MKEIKTSNGTWLVIPISSEATNFIINNIGCLRCTIMHGTLEENGPLLNTIDKYLGDYEIVSKLSEITKEQAEKIVETIHVEIPPHPSNDYCGDWDIAYVDYLMRGEFAGFNGDAGCFRNPIDSLHTLLEVNECYTINPNGDEPSPFDYGYYEEEEYNDYNAAVRKWKEAQDNLSDEWLILKLKESNVEIPLSQPAKPIREEGYYWVRGFVWNERTNWEIARWDGNGFWIDGDDFDETSMVEIDENQITRNERK